ncbi:DUF6269 family protein [Kitasatospora hibisci]|uniref:DUF6269 family protein n=1 Tax=Kitasatospora hibisci TaxID=3369522 RepID=UPI00375505EF
MSDDRFDSIQIPHPLAVLEQIEQDHDAEQEAELRADDAPWGEVLARYIDVLTELIASQPAQPPEVEEE